MNLDTYFKDFAGLFEDTDPKLIKAKTKFRNIEEWSSLAALSAIAMINLKYKIKMTGNDIRQSVTVEDLFNILKSKLHG